MGGETSKARRIYIGPSLARNIIRLALEELADSRASRAVLRGILCATRFKIPEERRLSETARCRCGGIDSFRHLLRRTPVTPPVPSEGPEPAALLLPELAGRAFHINAGLPKPRYPPVELDLDMDHATSSWTTSGAGPRQGLVSPPAGGRRREKYRRSVCWMGPGAKIRP